MRPSVVPRAFAVAAALLAVACAAVVTGSAVGTFTAPGRVVGQVGRPAAGASTAAPAPSLPSLAPDLPDDDAPAGGDGSRTTTVPLGAAGTVVLALRDGRLRAQVQPAAGWQVDRIEDGGTRVEVRLRGAGDARLEAAVEGGRIVVDKVRAPGT